jgi:lipopolysaccharide exporter
VTAAETGTPHVSYDEGAHTRSARIGGGEVSERVIPATVPDDAVDGPGVAVPRNPLTAGGWSGLSFIAANVIGGLVYYPLARRLTAEEFGLFAEANLIYLAMTLLAETAVAQALIQLRGERARLARAALWLSLGLGVVGAVLCVAAGPLAAAIFGEKELVALLALLAPGVIAAALGAAPHGLLARELDFRRKTLPETLAIAGGGAAALAGAFAGLGVYSLAAMALVSAVVSSGTAWWVCRLRPRLRPAPDSESFRRMGRFAATLGAGDLALYLRLNTDYALTGRLLGAHALGVYSLAWATSVGPQLFITAFTGRVGYALFAALQGDRERLRGVFLSGLRLVATAALPVSAGAVVVAPDLVPVALGSRWEAAVGPVMVLFALQLVRTVCGPGASLILATGRTRLYALVGAAALPATVAAVLAGTRGGVTGVAWAMLAAVGGVSLAYLALAMRVLRVRPAEATRLFGPPLMLTAAALPAVAGTRALLLWHTDAAPGVRLAAAILAGAAAGLVTLRLVWPALRGDLRRLRRALPAQILDEPVTGAPEPSTATPA